MTDGKTVEDCQGKLDEGIQSTENGANTEEALDANNLNSQPLNFQQPDQSRPKLVLPVEEDEDAAQENNIDEIFDL